MNLNIRQKVALVFGASIVVIALIAGYSYYYLKAIELKQHVVEVSNDLREIILEIRRYEKNYLLYGSPRICNKIWTRLNLPWKRWSRSYRKAGI